MMAEHQRAIAELLAAIGPLKARLAEAADGAEPIQQAVAERDSCRWRLAQKCPKAEKVKIQTRITHLTHEIGEAYSALAIDEIKEEVFGTFGHARGFLDALPVGSGPAQKIRSDLEACVFSAAFSHQRQVGPLSVAGTLRDLEHLERRLQELASSVKPENQSTPRSSEKPIEGEDQEQRLREIAKGHTAIPVRQAAQVLGKTEDHIRRLARGGRLESLGSGPNRKITVRSLFAVAGYPENPTDTD